MTIKRAKSPSARGAWIATRTASCSERMADEVSPSAKGAWIATLLVEGGREHRARSSPSARGAWIATCELPPRRGMPQPVALREGGVDRNVVRALEPALVPIWVALREGGVDRNIDRHRRRWLPM